MKKLIVDKKYNEKKLNRFLIDNVPNFSSTLFYKALKKKDIKVNDKRVSENLVVHTGDEICLYISDELLNSSNLLEVVFEDSNILILNKPFKLEVTGTNSLTTLVHNKYSTSEFKPMPCHRIDRNTTGLVLFAKNSEAFSILLNKFKNHEIKKFYYALVYGIPTERYKRCEAFLFKDAKKSRVFISDSFHNGYQKIITTYNVLKTYDNNTALLNVEIETGKTHQIRAHLAHIGYPIVGDRKIWNQLYK